MRIPVHIATAFGLEGLVADELRQLALEPFTVSNGRIDLVTDWTGLARLHVHLRMAERIWIPLASFKAKDFDTLFDGTRAIAWENWLSRDARMHVEGKSLRSKLSSVPACQAIVKKALIEAMRRSHRIERFPENGARHRILVSLVDDVATISLDATGDGLHKRGYRPLTGPAPLRETLAAAMVTLSRWEPDRILLDPCCGSGTLLVEAAWMAQNRAPGLSRSFDAEAWPMGDRQAWERVREEARAAIRHDVEFRGMYGQDRDGAILVQAREHLRLAGLESVVHVQRLPFEEWRTKRLYGVILANPPYGERIGDEAEIERLYRRFGQVLVENPSWSAFILTSNPRLEEWMGRRADRKRKLFNANLRTDLHQFFGPLPPSRRDSAPDDEFDHLPARIPQEET
jgi:putative N6-adenine-specific DNA methylase